MRGNAQNKRITATIHDEVTDSGAFPATIQKLDEDENLPEDSTGTG